MAKQRETGPAERKRLFEFAAIIFTSLLLIALSRLETRLFDLAESLARNEDFVTTIVYFGLINFNVILILVLSFLLFRNVAKLVVERRRGVLGSNLRAKLVAALVFFALAPTILLFYVSASFIITSFDEWFSEKVRSTMQQTREAGAKVYKQDQRRLESLARIALQRVDILTPEESFVVPERFFDPSALTGFETQYGLDDVKVFDHQANLLWSSRNDAEQGTYNVVADPFVLEAIGRFREEPGLWSMSTVVGEDQQDVVKGVAPIVNPVTQDLLGAILTETRFETQILKSIESIQTGFANLRPSAQLIKLSYQFLLGLMALLIIFAAVWLGFYVARGIIGPIQSLAEATREVALGNYNIKLTPKTDDDTGQLVRAFNRMTRDLQRHRIEAEKSRLALVRSNDELDQRRKYMEVVLKNITSGVIAVDADGLVTSVNSAAEELLSLDAKASVGRPVKLAIGSDLYQELWQPIAERVGRQRSYNAQIDVHVLGKELTILVDGTRISDESGEDLGMIVVFDDAAEQVKVQRVAAWREVARRIAHEIKNPVTPIKLSAQRLLRRFHERFEGDDREVFENCVETILKQVDSLRDLVNEFSKFSRLPSVQTTPGDINDVIRDVAKLFSSSYAKVEFDLDALGRLPLVAIDKDQMNRVFVNLVSNSVAAMEPAGQGRVEFRSMVLSDLNTVRVEVCDDGCGIPDRMRDRVLEPYFSTKDEGTGLGLAIVNQIVSDHGGYLRIVANEPRGTKVIIEMPLGGEATA